MNLMELMDAQSKIGVMRGGIKPEKCWGLKENGEETMITAKWSFVETVKRTTIWERMKRRAIGEGFH